jgi:hypothetical protein
MLFKDDDDVPSQSSAEYVTRADHGASEQHEKSAAHKGDLLALKRAMLRSQVDPKAGAQKAVKAEKDAESRDAQKVLQQDEAQGAAQPIGTKTSMEEADQQVQDAQESDTQDTLLDKAKQQKEVKQQAGEEYQQNMS